MKINIDKCFECNEPKEHMHHVIPKSKGGKKMIPLCAKCHGLIHDKHFLNHKYLIKQGMEKAKENGKHLGRIKGSVESKESLIIKHYDIVEELLNKKSIRKTAEITKKSIATIQKIKHIINEMNLVK